MNNQTRHEARGISRRDLLLTGGAAGLAVAAAGTGAALLSGRKGGVRRVVLRAMGGSVEVKAPADRVAMAREIVRIELGLMSARMSAFDPRSELSQINAGAGLCQVPLSTEMASVLEACARISEQTGGAYDPTVGPLLGAWGFRGGLGPASAAARREAAGRVGLHLVSCEGGRLGFSRPGMCLDLGGIAVGHGVDRAVETLASAGLTGVLINAAGDLRATGPRPDGRAWKVGIKDPLGRPGPFATLELTGTRALTTSGTYEKFVQARGRRVPHIFDPRDGGSPGEVISATVVADTALEADALATAAVVLGKKEAMQLLDRLPGVEGLLMVQGRGGRHEVLGTARINATILRAV